MVSAWADGAKPVSPDRAYIDSVIDSMVKAGTLTQDQAAQMKGDADAAAEAAAKANPAPPKKKSWNDWITVGGYTQGQFNYYADAPNPDHKAGKPSDEFLVRRARIVVKANPTDRAHFGFEGDFGQGAATVIQADLTYDVTADHAWRADLGQQYVPFGFEVPQSSSVRLPLEFSYMGSKEFPGQHDTGLVLYYTSPSDHALLARSKASEYGAGDFGNFAIGLFNGEGTSISEANSQKALSLRACKPFEFGSDHNYGEVGASYWDNTYNTYVGSATTMSQFEDRMWGVHAFIAPRPLGIQAEYSSGKTLGSDLTGWYVMGLWRPGSSDTVFLRYEDYDGLAKASNPTVSASGSSLTPFTRHDTSIGLAHMIDSNTRLTLEYDWENVDAEPIAHLSSYTNSQFGARLMVSY
jgi:hypothetical protein